ncbi:MAG: DUF5685 family protein [Clostridiales bacterium]|nr:DUF5685 family protein [Clostridiales bacterium]
MFGYIRAYKPEMKFKEYDIYRGAYCSVCRQLMRSYGPAAQLTLSYDTAFLALVLMAFSEECPQFEKGRCCYNPLKKCHKCINDGGAVEASADISMIMVYYKICDNISDSGFIKRTAAGFIKPVFSRIHKKAAKKQPEAEKIIADAMQAQAQAEANSGTGLDKAAHPTADAMGKLFELLIGEGKDIYRFGYLTGRMIYIMDALDDIEDDIKTGAFNPLKAKYGNSEDFRNYSDGMLNLTATELIKTYEKLNPCRYAGILDNIIYFGLSASERNIRDKKDKRSKKIKS